MNNDFFNVALKCAKKSLNTNDVPIGAVIVKNNKIISKSSNVRCKNNDILGHCEIICIKKAIKKLKSIYLYDCDLYVTLKPCSMCEKIINESRISNVYYLAEKPDFKKEYGKTKYKVINSELSTESISLLQNFFKKLR